MTDRSHSALPQNEDKIWKELQDIDIPMLEVPVPESPVIIQASSCCGPKSETSPTLSPCSPLVDTGWENPDYMDLFSILDYSSSHDVEEYDSTGVEEKVFPINDVLFDEQKDMVVQGSYTMPAEDSPDTILNKISARQQYEESIRDHIADTSQYGIPCEVSFMKNEGTCLNEVEGPKIKASVPADIAIDQTEISSIATPSEMQARKNRQRLARKRRMENQARKHRLRPFHGPTGKANSRSSTYMCMSTPRSEVVNTDPQIRFQSSVPLCQEEKVLASLQHCIKKLSWETRICIRDSLYRLAQSAKERQNGVQNNHCSNIWDSESRSSKETATNPLDRMVARLLFWNQHHGMESGSFLANHAQALEGDAFQTSFTRTAHQLHASCGSCINQQDQPVQMILGL